MSTPRPQADRTDRAVHFVYMNDQANPTVDLSDKMQKLVREKKVALEFQSRKHEDWNDNYELYRNKVKTNRLTQRQAVNIPLMKETIKTLMAKIDDAPNVDWKEKSGDEMKQLIFQEMWNKDSREKRFDWIDMLDKKNVLLYGLSTTQFNIGDDGVQMNVLDVMDVLFDPLMNPLDIETARFIVQCNIFKSLKEILADDRYTTEGKTKLNAWSMSPDGIVQSGKNREEYRKRQARLLAMGVKENELDKFSGGDVLVNLTQHATLEWENGGWVKHVVVYAQDQMELLDESLYDLLGVDFWPYVMWMEDPETNDIYPDGIADLVRTPNKLINIWLSQMTENRTLQNFTMHWYDASNQKYQPQVYEPGPGRMLPAPGNPKDTIMPVEINALDETMNAINFLTAIVERGTGATAIEKGTPETGAQTLGEVQILVGNAQERALSMTKFYRAAWYERARKWSELIQANPPGSTTLYKTGRDGTIYPKVVTPKDWQSKAGYEPVVSSTSEHERDEVKTLQKFQFVMQQNPNNMALKRIALKRELESLDLTPDELADVEAAEKEAQQAALAATTAPAAGPQPAPTPSPVQPQASGVDPQQLAELQAVMQ